MYSCTPILKRTGRLHIRNVTHAHKVQTNKEIWHCIVTAQNHLLLMSKKIHHKQRRYEQIR